MALADVVDLLACPTCAAQGRPDVPLPMDGDGLRCAHGHAFDVARQGHVNLLGHAAPHHADTAAMVAARERFLATGAYDPVADALAGLVAGLGNATVAVLDLGSGPGWYLDRVLAGVDAGGRAGRGLALDVSVAAARRAARSPWRVGAVVADAWRRLPVRSASVDVALSVFAPRTPAELARVLAPGGAALVVGPHPEHLAGLRAAWGLLDVEPGKQERVAAVFAEHLEPAGLTDLRYEAALDPAAVVDLVGMGPNAFHEARSPDARPPGTVQVALRLGVWRRAG